MKINTFKVTAASALLATTILGSPVLGNAHGKGEGRDGGHKDDKQRSHQMMNHKQDRKEHRQGRYNGQNQDNRDKRVDIKLKDSKITDKNKVKNKVKNKLEKVKSKTEKSSKKINKVNTSNTVQNKVKKVAKVPVVSYAEADEYGKKTVLPLIAGLETARASLDWDNLTKNYNLLFKELKKGNEIFGKVEGKENRERLISTYKVPAIEKSTELALPISIYNGINQIEDLLKAKNTVKAAVKIEKLKLLVDKLGSVENDALLTNLVEKVNSVDSKIKATKATSNNYQAVSI
ncbi:hypothetical protein [Psychrobacillus sp. FSL K6-1464]|uniref:hypothetical protein n=1 Tax=Psychrobacillus sp. FSL K6-1464 TaxID=2921545 RepID=UPI0030F63D31